MFWINKNIVTEDNKRVNRKDPQSEKDIAYNREIIAFKGICYQKAVKRREGKTQRQKDNVENAENLWGGFFRVESICKLNIFELKKSINFEINLQHSKFPSTVVD